MPDLKAYVEDQIAAGRPKGEIRAALLKAGYSKEVVDGLLKTYSERNLSAKKDWGLIGLALVGIAVLAYAGYQYVPARDSISESSFFQSVNCLNGTVIVANPTEEDFPIGKVSILSTSLDKILKNDREISPGDYYTFDFGEPLTGGDVAALLPNGRALKVGC